MLDMFGMCERFVNYLQVWVDALGSFETGFMAAQKLFIGFWVSRLAIGGYFAYQQRLFDTIFAM